MREAQRKLLINVMEAADMTDVGRSTIYNLIIGGELQSVKVGRRRLIPIRALEEYVERLLEESR